MGGKNLLGWGRIESIYALPDQLMHGEMIFEESFHKYSLLMVEFGLVAAGLQPVG